MAVATACGSNPSTIDVSGVITADGIEVEGVIDNLNGPTQFVIPNDERLWVATINGGENDMEGQVTRVDLVTKQRWVAADGLDKPTGIALLGFELWIMERDQLSHLDVSPTSTLVEPPPRVIVRNLPNNGRSEGTLTRTPDNQLLFNTSGSKRGADVADGSGRLFMLDAQNIFDRDPDDWQGAPIEIASGFKHAYAHAYDEDGDLWVTEMTDGLFDGEAAADEVVLVKSDTDHGWPRCVGNNRAVVEFGGTEQECANIPTSLATFAPGASPTSVVVSPFEPNTLLVALWNEGRIVAVDMTNPDPTSYSDFAMGLDNPQHLVVFENAVYVSEYTAGRILRLTKTNQ